MSTALSRRDASLLRPLLPTDDEFSSQLMPPPTPPVDRPMLLSQLLPPLPPVGRPMPLSADSRLASVAADSVRFSKFFARFSEFLPCLSEFLPCLSESLPYLSEFLSCLSSVLLKEIPRLLFALEGGRLLLNQD